MRTTAKRLNRHTSLAETLSALTRSLSFQVQMIMWEDRKSGRAGTQGLAVGNDARLKPPGSFI